jgi:hypothetical protein
METADSFLPDYTVYSLLWEPQIAYVCGATLNVLLQICIFTLRKKSQVREQTLTKFSG